MSNEPMDDAADARGDLAVWLDNYTAGRCDRAQMQASFLEICRSNPEAPWDALALLDQYQRRGRVDATLARSLKSDIAQLVFGVVNETEDEVEAPVSSPQEATTTSDTTGTRWRRMMVDREPPAAEQAFVDPVQFRRDVDPPTRPPPPEYARRGRVVGVGADTSTLRDRYDLLSILGRGSKGTVYKALDRHRTHLDPSARCVAVRVFNLNYRDSPEALAELERQFHQAQSLSHPNIVNVFDLDRDGATYFLVMELLEGELLSEIIERLDRRPMERSRALATIGSIGAALSHAHRRGVVHADLRPGNVMIALNGDVKVMDIGFARRAHADPQRSEPWIGDPALGGRPGLNVAYASEERVNGDPPDPADDVYSLACLAYELLSGQHPYGGRSAPLARAHGRMPQKISGLSGRQWNALQTALRWSRDERRIDVVELVAGLGCADVTQRQGPPQQIVADEHHPRRFGPFAAFSVALLAIVVAAGGYLALRDRFTAPIADTADVQPAATVPIEAAPTGEAPTGAASIKVEPEPVAAAPVQVDPAPATPQTTQPAPAQAAPKQTAPKQTAPKQTAPVERPAQTASVPAAASGGGIARIAFDKDSFVATESDGSVKLTVRRTRSMRSEVPFQWRLIANSAEAGNDFAAIGPGSEVIAAGTSTASILIPLVSDSVKESTELFLVELSAVNDKTEIGELSRAVVIVVDDD